MYPVAAFEVLKAPLRRRGFPICQLIIVVALVELGFWSHTIFSKFWDVRLEMSILAWAPLGFVGVCIYAESSLKSFRADITSLEKTKYQFKTL